MKESVVNTMIFRSFCKWASANGSPLYYWKARDYFGLNTFDISFCVRGGIYGAIETKVSRNKNLINFARLFSNRNHQLEALIRVGLCGGNPWVVIRHGRRTMALRPETAKALIGNGKPDTFDGLVGTRLAVELPAMGGGLVDVTPLIR